MSTATANIASYQSVAGVRDYISLLKPRVMSLVVFTGFVGLYLAPGAINPLIAAVAVFCIALGSGAAGAINMWYERDIDAIMQRTQSRAIPTGRILPENALDFALVCAFASVFIMSVAVNFLAGALLLAAILYYVFVYTTWLKRRTPQNIVIGGAAGAFPPMIGWAAVTGGLSIEPLILFAIIFMWTPPHFWALSLYRSDDYAKAGIPMLPVTSGIAETVKQMLIYTILLVPLTLMPYFMNMSGVVYLVGACLLGAGFLSHAITVRKSSEFGIRSSESQEDSAAKLESAARKMFGFSILYLFGIFLLLVIDRAIGY